MSNQGYALTKKVSLQTAAAATGNGTAMDVRGWAAVALQVTDTFVGTITFEGTVDDTNWVSLQGANVADGAVSTSATAAGIYVIPCVALSQFRAPVSAWTSGTITAIGQAVTAAPGMTLADVDILGAEVVSVSNLPAALAAGGGLKVEGVAGGVALPIAHPTALSTVACGELQGSATALQCPTVTSVYVRFKACVSNAGNVYIGGASVTKPDGTTDTTTGLELTPGDDTGWLPASNVNKFYRICDNAGDDCVYLILA